MNPQFQQIIVQTTIGSDSPKPPSKYNQAKQLYLLKKMIFQNIRNGFMILIGILSAGFGLKSFILPNNFIDGGATGISLLLTIKTEFSLSLTILLINIPFIIVGYYQMGRAFVIKTIIAIIGLAICLATVPFPFVTDDKILGAVFGGFFLGAGIGFAMRGGAVLDGTEVMAIFLSKKISASIGDVIMIINVIIFSAAVKLLGVVPALYSMIAYLAASKTVDFLVVGIEEYTGVTIISPKSAEITEMIVKKLGRGITVYNGKGGYGKRGYSSTANTNIIYTVITRLEISKLESELDLIDPNAFVVMHSIKDTKGGMIKKRPMSH